MKLDMLPQELIDTIIEQVHGDPATLKCCALVCHAWLSPSRSHIFHRISLQPPQVTRRFLPWAARKLALQSLLSAIKTTPAIATYVNELEVVEGFGERAWVAKDKNLVDLLILMKHVRRFEVRHSTAAGRIVWISLSQNLRTAIFHLLASSSLRVLKLERIVLSAEELGPILASSNNLRALYLDHVAVNHPSPPRSPRVNHITSQAPLDTLVLGERTSIRVVECLLRSPPIFDVTHLRNLGLSLSGNFGEFSRILRSMPFIESLELLLMSDISLAAYGSLPLSERFDFSHNTFISVLYVGIDVLQKQDDPLPWLNALFSTIIAPNSLRRAHIVYSVYLPSPYMDRSMNTKVFSAWEDIDATLTSPTFESLEQVHLEFSLENPIGFGVAPRFLKEMDLKSPKLRARNRLVVEAYDTSR